MDGYIDKFCSVLRAGLWDKPVGQRLDADEMRRIWSDARKQAVCGLVAEALLATGEIPPRTSEMLQKKLMAIAAKNFKSSHLLADSVKALSARGVEPVLLKGLGVASCYRQPLVRECGDIDLYVGVKDYRKSFDILVENLENVECSEFSENEKHSHVIVRGIPIEIHQFCDVLAPKYNPAFQEIASKCLSDGFCQLKVDDISVRIPEPTFNAMFIFEHIWSHFVAAGVGFRQICDWTLFLHSNHDRIDGERLRGMLEALDLMKPWKVFGFIASNALGLPKDEMPFYDGSMKRTADKVIDMVMKEGNFGHEREDRWAESGNQFKDTLKQFFIVTRRYLKVIPMFGNLAYQEYKTKLLYHLGR